MSVIHCRDLQTDFYIEMWVQVGMHIAYTGKLYFVVDHIFIDESLKRKIHEVQQKITATSHGVNGVYTVDYGTMTIVMLCSSFLHNHVQNDTHACTPLNEHPSR